MSAVDYVTYFLLIHDFDRDEANTRAKNSLVELGLQDAMYRKYVLIQEG